MPRVIRRGHIRAGIPAQLPGELVEVLASGADARVERIVSRGHASPPGFWYDQDEDEWVVVLAGAARLAIEGQVDEIALAEGEWIDLPRHVRHRVTWTTPERDTIWLAVFRRG